MEREEFVKNLHEALAARDAELRSEFSRSLPFGDAMFDRWERAKREGFGEGTSVYDSCCIFGDVRVGSNVWIGPWTMLDGSGGLVIGDYVSVSSGVHIYSHDTVHWALSGGAIEPRRGAVTIGSRVYIGSQSVIAQGVTIGSECVISANSFVRSDVPSRTIVGGSPAKAIGRVEAEGASVRMVFDHSEG